MAGSKMPHPIASRKYQKVWFFSKSFPKKFLDLLRQEGLNDPPEGM